MNHKKHNYEIEFCNPKNDWGVASGKFHVNSAIGCSNYFDTYEQANKAAIASIDSFIETVPQTKAEWIGALRSCMVWSGYEDCDLDENMVWSLLQKASKHLTKEEI
jgi:hypothetical protein